ncbi:hypothetical protein DFJ58DRAFT_762342 [Suillus subalutaceus]|uniref:uncharacterized protein n=1 Tax=Suillus subalutaceus TaxID=48586 RepID=UPI001B86A12B|nr:uncharacterized protein DFJ58DRAFT_762342 [Suillus subalutaceus]KAG1871771.1 hypothetical protein DFJ58DRAFT_762342 [Suillus subalutaceus]
MPVSVSTRVTQIVILPLGSSIVTIALFDMHYGQASTILRQNFSWSRVDPTIFASDEDMMQAVINEQVWLALVVETNATDKLSDARKTGNSTFNSTSLLTVHYAQARQEIAVGTYVLDYGNLPQPPWRDYVVSCCYFCTAIFHVNLWARSDQ